MADEFTFNEPRVEWGECHAAILRDFLHSLEQNQLRYIILKNAEGLPFENHAKDIDILIEPGKYAQAAECLRNAYLKHGLTHVLIHRFEKLRCWYGMNVDKRIFIHIDLLESFFHKGCELFPFDLFYSNAYRNENGIRVLNEVYDGVILLLHSTICYHSIKEKYAVKIAGIYERHAPEIDALLEAVLGGKAAMRMSTLLQQQKYKEIAASGKYFSHASKWRILRKRPFFTLFNIADFLCEKAARLVICQRKYRRLISVHAPDGTGKTTFIQALATQLGDCFIANPEGLLSICHFRPCVLPNLGAAGEKMRMMKQDTNFTVPHRAKPAGFISSLARMTYYWADYLVGVPLILRRNAQFDRITLFDRYIYDFLVDPHRSRISLPRWIRNVFASLVPRPRIVFVLDASAETIYMRKQELEPKEIQRQLNEFRRLRHKGEFVHMLNAERAPWDMANEALRIVLDRFCERLT